MSLQLEIFEPIPSTLQDNNLMPCMTELYPRPVQSTAVCVDIINSLIYVLFFIVVQVLFRTFILERL